MYSIAIHIKMTGQLIYVGSASNSTGAKLSEKVGGELPHKHTHVIFKLKTQNARLAGRQAKIKDTDQNSKVQEAVLYYNDIRQFGWLKIVKAEEVFELPFFRELGPEIFPSAGQKALTLDQFKVILQKTKGPIKPLLMDQKKIGGVGNIYANDALYVAKIDPKRKAASLSANDAERLFEALKTVLAKGLEVGGASEWQYVNALGQTGNYQNFFQVYGKVGKPCKRCGTTIKKIVMAGRGTFFCPRCQN
jgi:formamidopyrimidine-DNA glycosylase